MKSNESSCFLCDNPLNFHMAECSTKKEDTYLCWYCDHDFTEKKILEVHIKIDHGHSVYANEHLTWYCCQLCCEKLYMRAQDLVKHLRMVHKQKNIRIDEHLISSVQDVMYACETCGKPTILSKQCAIHKGKKGVMKKTTKKRNRIRAFKNLKHICYYCEESFEVKDFLEAHIKLEHGGIVYCNSELVWYACNVCCDKLYMRAQDIIKHMRNVHGKLGIECKQFVVHSQQDVTSKCSQCDKLCILSKRCHEHKEKLKFDKTGEDFSFSSAISSRCNEHDHCHSCQRCDFIFEECNHLWSHMFSEHKSKRNMFVCNLCDGMGVVIKNPTTLTRHMNKFHKKNFKLDITARSDELKEKAKIIVDGVEMFKCPECGTLLKNIWSLREHIMIHTGEKPHICQVCSKSFRNRGKLNVHYKRVHEHVRDHQCNYCGRAFSDKSNLNVHIRTHTDEKKYMCELCGAEFAQWATLYNHKFTHNDTKFKCTHCDKVYNNPSNLQRHVKVHTDTSLYICEICGKDFGTARYLKRHKDIHNSTNTFTCEICNAGFKLKKHFTQHYKLHSMFPPQQYPHNVAPERSIYKL